MKAKRGVNVKPKRVVVKLVYVPTPDADARMAKAMGIVLQAARAEEEDNDGS